MPLNSKTNNSPTVCVPTLELPPVIQQITTAISAGRRFLMVPHIHIDGDDLGSMIGLALALKQLDKEVYLYSPDPVPERYQFLQGHELITSTLPQGEFDAVFILECPDFKRLPPGLYPKQLTQTIITLDHHEDSPTEERFIGNINWVDPTMSALGEMIALIIFALDLDISAQVATAIYTSIVSDSQAFRFHGVSSRTHLIAAKLLASADIDTNLVHNWTLAYRSQQEQRVTQRCAATREYICNGQVALAELTREMLNEAGLEDDSAIQNLLHDINNEYKAAFALFKNIDGQKIRVSLRSQSVPVLPIAHKFGGGGHALACAMTFPTTDLASVKSLVRAELEKLFGS
ncbi:MAG: DHHA1 domain-containing protein [bacterium]|nr:DHHA1 domain-containing protein [bacterium]